MTATRKVPMEPLVERVAWQLGREPSSLSTREIAEVLGVAQRTVQRWVSDNKTLSISSCDRLAVHLGWHPCLVWGDSWADQ